VALLVVGCATSTPGFVGTDPESAIITIGAGHAVVSDSGDDYWRLWYIIDPATRTCWFKIGDSVGSLECCRLWNVKRARPYLIRQLGLTCDASSAP